MSQISHSSRRSDFIPGLFWILECAAIVGIVVWSVFDPRLGGQAYVVVAGAATFSCFIYQFLWHPNSLPDSANDVQFDADELRALRKYHFWFKYPVFAIAMCSIASLLQLTAMVCVPWFLYQSQWIPAIAGGICFIVGPFFRERFDPRNYLAMAVSKKPDWGFSSDLAAVDRALEKLVRLRALKSGAH